VNTGPVGLGRFSTLRSWLSQWSIDDTNADGLECAARMSIPMLVIENTADDAVPQPHARLVFEAASSSDKTFELMRGATHYYAGQPEHLHDVTQLILEWLAHRSLIER
jgi:alpha/beta superfamily hydrolase